MKAVKRADTTICQHNFPESAQHNPTAQETQEAPWKYKIHIKIVQEAGWA